MRCRKALLGAVAATFLGVFASTAAADREHRVTEGQTLSAIAQRNGVSVQALASANGLRPDATIRAGQILKVPERGVVHVQSGQTLSTIARANHVSVVDLAKANRLDERSTLQVGQALVLPGFERRAEAQKAEKRWGRPQRPGVVSFLRIATNQTARITLVDARGRVRPAAIKQLEALLKDRRTGKSRPLDKRLVQLIARVSDYFGGRPIHVISGVRAAGGYTKETSRHTRGQAIDIRIPGVPNEALRDYCRTLGSVGVGFYPRSRFVHLDVRDEPGYWVDWSRPGEAPRYRKGAPLDDEQEEGREVARDQADEDSSEPGV